MSAIATPAAITRHDREHAAALRRLGGGCGAPSRAVGEAANITDLVDRTGTLIQGKPPRRVSPSHAADFVVRAIGQQFAYDSRAATWYRFAGTHWDATDATIALNEHLMRYLYCVTDPLGFGPKYAKDILEVITTANSLPLPVTPEGAIPFANGLLDIVSGDLIPTTPKNALTWSLPYPYDPVARPDCPAILAWLSQAVGGDAETVLMIRAIIAAILVGPAKYQKFLHLIGPGGTGKSTFLRLLTAMVGEPNIFSTDLQYLEKNRFETAALRGKRLALISDSDKYGGSINVLKRLTGQDHVRYEKKYKQQESTFTFAGMIIMASNESLRTTDHTSGLERRRITVSFLKRFSNQERREFNAAGGEDRLKAEIPGMIAWALAMPVADVDRIIMSPPSRVATDNLTAMRNSNPVADWLIENCVPDPASKLTLIGMSNKRSDRATGQTYYADAEHHLFPNYLAHCLGVLTHPLGQRNFTDALLDALQNCLHVDVERGRSKRGCGIKRIRLRAPDEPPYDWASRVTGDGDAEVF